ncbi:hypothetical protein [Kitasatospora sp. NPDC056531]
MSAFHRQITALAVGGILLVARGAAGPLQIALRESNTELRTPITPRTRLR